MDTQTAEILTVEEALSSSIEDDSRADVAADDDADDVARLVPLIEGLLFAAGAPVPIARLMEALDGPDRAAVTEALELLGERLEREGRGLRLVRVAGGYQLRTL